MENLKLKLEIETMKSENAALREENNKLGQLIGELSRITRPQPPPRGLQSSSSQSQASSDSTGSELQRKLDRTLQQLNETRQQLSNAQGQLNTAKQVNAATQRRQMQQEGAFQNIPPGTVYEQLRFDRSQEHNRAQLTAHTGLY